MSTDFSPIEPSRVIVIGASAGGVEALTTLVTALPEDFPAAVLITHHQAPQAQSLMPSILSRAGKLVARHALNNQPILPGRIYLAPPDKHLLVKQNRLILGTGPRENCTRPAIDPLFRTAAAAYGANVIAVILSGNLDDGTLGLGIVKEHGGIAIVQDPHDAPYPGMPESAIENVAVDYILPLADIGPTVVSLVAGKEPENLMVTPTNDDENPIADPAEGLMAARECKKWGTPSVYTCPDCHGTLWEMETVSGVLRFRCRVGHAYSSTTLAAQQGDRVEEALWTALRALEERSSLVERLAKRARNQKQGHTARRYEKQKMELDVQAQLLRAILEQGQIDAKNPQDVEEA